MNRIKINTENLNTKAYNELIEFERNQNYTVHYDDDILITHIDGMEELDKYTELKKYLIKQNGTINYVMQYLLDCETNQDDMLVNVRGQMEDVEIIDVIGVIEEKGRIYVGLEVEYEEYCYLININFMNTWEYVYKDEMIEIQDVVNNLVSAQLKTNLGFQDNILDDVKQWLKDNMEQYDNKKDLLDEIVTYGVENVAPNHLIYNEDIQLYYDEHREEINSIVEEETGYSIDDAIEDLDAFEVVINSVGGLDSELEFENSHELENSELRWFVWLAFERVTYEYLEHLESKEYLNGLI